MNVEGLFTCRRARRAVSARLDNEATGLDDRALDAHLDRCAACARFAHQASVAHRHMRVRPAGAVPDLGAAIEARIGEDDRHARSAVAPSETERQRELRLGLGVLALVQLAFCVPSLIGGDAGVDTLGAVRQMASGEVALAVGLLAVALRPRSVRGLLPVVAAFTTCLVVTAAFDVVGRRTTLAHEATHLIDVLGLVVLWMLDRELRYPTGQAPSVAARLTRIAGSARSLVLRWSMDVRLRRRSLGCLPYPLAWTRTAVSTAVGTFGTRRLRTLLGWRAGAIAAGVVLSTVGMLGLATPASAHAVLESTSPTQGAVLLHAPKTVVLHFGEPVEIDFGSVQVLGPDGKRADQGGTEHPPGDSHSVETRLPANLARGTYVVAWHVISADSHPVHGAFEFSVGAATSSAKANAEVAQVANQSGSTSVGVVYWFVRMAAFAGLLLLVGVGAVVAAVWPKGGRATRVRRLLWGSWGLLVVATLAAIAVQGIYAAELPLTDVARPHVFDAVLHTRFGRVELLRLVLLAAAIPVLVVLGGQRWQQNRRWCLYASVPLGLALLATPGLAGHAATGTEIPLGIATDLVHLTAASLWLGGLAVLCAVLVRGGRAGDRPDDIRAVALRISAVAFWAVIAIVISGTVQAIRQVGSINGLLHTTYGITLLVKIGLVCVLIGLGATSRRVVHGSLALPLVSWWRDRWTARRSAGRQPAASGVSMSGSGTTGTAASISPGDGPRAGMPLAVAGVAVAERTSGGEGFDRTTPESKGPGDGQRPGNAGGGREGTAIRKLRRSVLAEALVALAVLGVTALLVNAEPAKEVAAQPFSQTVSVLGVQVNVIIDPAQAATGNEVHFYVLGPSGAPKAIPELDATLSLPSRNIQSLPITLIAAGPGHYLATGLDIPYAGTWRLDITVRTSALDEQEVSVTVPVH